MPSFLAYEDAPKDIFSRFLKQSVAIGAALLIITSVAPATLLETGVSADYFDGSTDYAEDETSPVDWGLPESDDGFFLKLHPQEGEDVDRLGFTDKVTHIVESGETLSEIADRYGLKISTVVWENKFDEDAILSVGKTLIIPPVDGVSHNVTGSKETLDKIAKLYGVEPDLIRKHNQLTDDTIQKGQSLFIPGAKPLASAREGVRASGRRLAEADTFEMKSGIATSERPPEGRLFIFPTAGRISRGFSGGHYGLDVSNVSKPDVWAAGSGKVIKTAGGCPPREEGRLLGCNGGYGNHLVIDHGNGIQTLYGHLETIYVTEGQEVEQGQLVGKMGNSGRVFGPTGIHLHFEVVDNGVKRNPVKYY